MAEDLVDFAVAGEEVDFRNNVRPFLMAVITEKSVIQLNYNSEYSFAW